MAERVSVTTLRVSTSSGHYGAAPLALVVLGGGAPGVYSLPAAGDVDLGRAAECLVCIDDPSVSRRHARIRVSPDGVYLSDAGSKHGTRVGAQTLGPEENRLLTPGLVLELGTVIILVQVHGTPLSRMELKAVPRTQASGRDFQACALAVLEALQPTGSPVVLLGENGVGRRRLLRALHATEPARVYQEIDCRCISTPKAMEQALRNADFVVLDECCALPEALQRWLLAQKEALATHRWFGTTDVDPREELARGSLGQAFHAWLCAVELRFPRAR